MEGHGDLSMLSQSDRFLKRGTHLFEQPVLHNLRCGIPDLGADYAHKAVLEIPANHVCLASATNERFADPCERLLALSVAGDPLHVH